MLGQDERRLLYCAAAAVAVVLLLAAAYYAWREAEAHKGSFTPHGGPRVPDNPGNPQNYEYGAFLRARAALGGGRHGGAPRHRGYDRGGGGASCVDFDHGHGYHENDGLGELMTSRPRGGDHMMNTFHWDQMGTYQHTPGTWGLPTGHAGDSRVNYSGYSKERMGVGSHWDQLGTYGHTGATLPTYGLSGYYADVPTSPWA
jgi:hypothetical protein